MKLFDKCIYPIEFHFRTDTLYKRDTDKLIINIRMKMKNMYLDTPVHTIIKSRPMSDIQHSGINTAIKTDMNCIYTICRYKFIRIVHIQISSRKTDLTSYLISSHNDTIQKIIISKTTVCHAHIS